MRATSNPVARPGPGLLPALGRAAQTDAARIVEPTKVTAISLFIDFYRLLPSHQVRPVPGRKVEPRGRSDGGGVRHRRAGAG